MPTSTSLMRTVGAVQAPAGAFEQLTPQLSEGEPPVVLALPPLEAPPLEEPPVEAPPLDAPPLVEARPPVPGC